MTNGAAIAGVGVGWYIEWLSPTEAYLFSPAGTNLGRWFKDRPDISTFDAPMTSQIPGVDNRGAGAPVGAGAAAVTPTLPAEGAPGGTDWNAIRAFFPDLSDEEWDALMLVMPPDLNVQEGFNWIKLAVETGVAVRGQDLAYELGMANNEVAQIQAEAAALNAETNRLQALGLLEEARLSREQELLISRELNELNKYIAEMQNQVATLGLEIQERAYGAQLGAQPINTWEYEMWKRAGGTTAPVEIPEAPVPQEPVVPGATPTQGIPTPPTVPGAQRGLAVYSPKEGRAPVRSVGKAPQAGELLQVGEGKGGWEYVHAPAGTVVAPRAKGETKPTQAGGERAISKQLAETPGRRASPASQGAPQGKRVPYGWMKRRQSGSVRQMQGGGYVDPGTHTDEEMAALLASALAGWPALWNPKLGGVGVFGEQIPSPGQVGRRQYYQMDPSGRDILASALKSGIVTPEYGQVGGLGLVQDWLSQMQRSWIPGLEGVKKSVQYAY